MKTLSKILLAGVAALSAASCARENPGTGLPEGKAAVSMSGRDVARMLSSLPLLRPQLQEVYDAVSCSSGNGYDEEYMMSDLLSSPGTGVGGNSSSTKTSYSEPIRDMIVEYLSAHAPSSTRGGAADVQKYLSDLQESGLQIYWPYSENWDGETAPLITFDPGDGSEGNYAYIVAGPEDGFAVKDSVFVDEAVARKRPVWVINSNDDSSFVPLDACLKSKSWTGFDDEPDDVPKYNLYIKDFTMLRNYDTWFAGASEFHVWTGGVDGFYASTEEELRRYSPSVTDFVVVVKRNEIGVRKQFNAVMVTDFSDQLDKLAFLIVEDDGGTRTSWKCSASVKMKSKSYGFEISIPLNMYDDIVWRGQLGATYFTKGKSIEGRFGDVKLTFALE